MVGDVWYLTIVTAISDALS